MMNRARNRISTRPASGMTMMELLIAMALGLMVMIVILMMYSSARQSFRLQNGLTRVQEDGRVAIHLISDEVRQAGFRSPVWNNPLQGYAPLTQGSVNGANGGNDTLQLMYMDHEDCDSVVNTAIDSETTEPRADYKRITLSVDTNGELLFNCEYGSDPGNLQTQIANQTVVNGVESFQVLYGIDTDFPPDFSINAWTTADGFNPQTSVCVQSQYLCEADGLLGDIANGIPAALRIGLLIASPESTGSETTSDSFQVLDVSLETANDSRLRKTFTSTITLRNLTL